MTKRKRRGLVRVSPDLLARVRLGALALFLFSMPIFFLPGNTEYGYTKSIYTLVYVSLLWGLWGLEALARREWRVDFTWLGAVLAALIGVSAISLAGGTPACVVVQSATLLLYFGLVYFAVVNTVERERDVVLLLSALLAAGFLTGLYGLLQYLGVMRGGPGKGLSALISTMGNRNYLGGYLSYIFLPSLILIFRLRRSLPRALAVVGLGFDLAMTLFVQQTGVRLGLLAGALAVAFGLGRWPVGGVKRDWPWWAAAAAVILASLFALLGPGEAAVSLVVLAGLGGVFYLLGRLLRRFRRAWIAVAVGGIAALVLVLPVTTPIGPVRDAWQRNAGRVRAWDWWVGYEIWRDHPLTGVGLGGYKIAFVPYKADFLSSPQGAAYDFPIARAAQAHNEYVQVAAELGTLGVLVLAAGVGLVFLLLYLRLNREEGEKRLELLLLGGGLVAFLVHAAVSFPWHLPASSLAFVSILGIALSRRYQGPGSLAVTVRGLPLKPAVAVVMALGVAVSVVGIRDLIGDRYLQRGQISLYVGNTTQAIAQLKRAVALDFCPRHSVYWLGLAQLKAGDLKAAQASLREAFRRFKAEPAYINLAWVDFELGDYAEARKLLNELLTTHPDRDSELGALYLLALVDLKQAGDYDSAASRLRAILDRDPRFERALILLGEIALKTGRPEEAREYLNRALRVIDDKLARLHRKFSGGARLTPQEYGSLSSDLARLKSERERVERELAQLP